MTVIFSIEIVEKRGQENSLAPTIYYLPIFSLCFLLCFPHSKLLLSFLTLEKCLYLREQDTGQGLYLVVGYPGTVVLIFRFLANRSRPLS